MGCGASAHGRNTMRPTRFSNPEEFSLEGLNFSDSPPPIVATQGIHPKALSAHSKRSLRTVVKTNEGAILVYPSQDATVDVLFYYPEFSATVGKPAASCFGTHVRQVKPRTIREVLEDVHDTVVDAADAAKSHFTAFASNVKGFAEEIVTGRSSGNDKGNQAAHSAPATPAAAEQPPPPDPRRPGAPNWTEGAVCQLKEFDTFDDVKKPWFRQAGGIPGVFRLETAGPNGAWATLSPHTYQQRWVLPDGVRLATFDDDALSVPERIYYGFKRNGGNEFLRELCDRLEGARDASAALFLAAVADTADCSGSDSDDDLPPVRGVAANNRQMQRLQRAAIEKAKAFMEYDIRGLVKVFEAEIEKFKDYETIHQLPEELNPVKPILAYLEDALLYNWFDVGLDADVEVGERYFKKAEQRQQVYEEWSLFDYVMSKCIDKGNDLADSALKELKEQLSGLSEKVLRTAFQGDTDGGWLGGDDNGELEKKVRRQVEILFPDIDDMIDMDLASLDTQLHGIVSELPPSYPPHEVAGMLDKWRREDAMPLEERRSRHYATVAKRFKTLCENAEGNYEKFRAIAQQSRIPSILPRHFYEFTFVLLFPRLKDHDPLHCRKPSEAVFVIWPEGCLEDEIRVRMTDFSLPNGGVDDENPVIELAADLFDNGDDTIDDAKDPRNRWQDYPSGDWRGFHASASVACDITWNFNFELDGVVFLDHNSFNLEPDREYFRRVRFEQRSRVHTFNPLTYLGLVV